MFHALHRFARGMRRWTCSALALLVLLAAAEPASAAVIYVDIKAPPGGNGQTWQTAFRSPHQALKIAQPGDEIRIAQGVYRPAAFNGNRMRSFNLSQGVKVQGGYAGLSHSNPNLLNPSQFITRLSGDLNKNDGNSAPGSGAWADNSFHVVKAINITRATLLRGLVISNGNANSTQYDSTEQRGGGILCLGGSGPTIEQCTIERNFAQLEGAGLYSNGNPLIKSSLVRKNKTNHAGGGLWVNKATIRNSTFIQNLGPIAYSGGGGISGNKIIVTTCTFNSNSSSAISCGNKSFIRNCLFDGNGSEDGGAIFLWQGDAAIIECDFQSNSAASFGGAVMTNWDSAATVVNCRFAGNQAWMGAAVYDRGSLHAVNCAFSGNFLPFGESQSTIHNRGGSMQLINCTIAYNVNNQTGAAIVCHTGATLALHNCIVWGNESDGVRSEFTQILADGSVDIQFCCIEGWSGAMGGQGTFASDPLFLNVAGADGILGTLDDDLRLAHNSSCVDAGASELLGPDEFDLDGDGNQQEPIALDVDGQPRIIGPAVDLGALETP